MDTGSGSCGIVIFSFKEKDCRGRTIWRKIEGNIGNPLPEQLIKGRKINFYVLAFGFSTNFWTYNQSDHGKFLRRSYLQKKSKYLGEHKMALNTTPCNRYLYPSVPYSTNHNPATAFCQGSKQTYLLHNAENCQSNSYSRIIKFLQAVVEHGTNQIIISCAGWRPLILLSFSWNSQVVQDFAWPESCFPLLWEKSYCACKFQRSADMDVLTNRVFLLETIIWLEISAQ